MPSFIQGPYRLHRSLLDDALRGGECLPMNPARGRAPRKRQSRGRTHGCRHPTQVRSILTPKAFFLCRLHKLAPDTATSHAGAENAIPRFCADVAKPCSFPLVRHIFSAQSRTSLSRPAISGSPKFCPPYHSRRFGGPPARPSEDEFTFFNRPADPKRGLRLVPNRNASRDTRSGHPSTQGKCLRVRASTPPRGVPLTGYRPSLAKGGALGRPATPSIRSATGWIFLSETARFYRRSASLIQVGHSPRGDRSAVAN